MNDPVAAPSASPRQSAIYEAREAGGNLQIQACAGSGKTTTLVGLAYRTHFSARVLALSFNKSIADELKNRMPPHVESATMHSVGLRSCKGGGRRVNVDAQKINNILDAHPDLTAMREAGNMVKGDLRILVDLCTDTMTSPEDHPAVLATVERCGRDLEAPETSVPLLEDVMRRMDADRDNVSFGDMLRHPVIHGYRPQTYDLVLCDEAQDLNALQHAMLKKLVAPGGQLVGVGDRCQSIYAFRGADPSSMDRLRADWGSRELPLDVSFRCPRSVVRMAARIVGNDLIKPADTAPEGEIISRTVEHLDQTLAEAREGDMLICRINAPLVSLALKIIASGRKAIVRGRDIGSDLAGTVRKLKARSIPELLEKLEAWAEKQKTRAMRNARNPEAVRQRIDDKVETIRVLAMESQGPEDLNRRIGVLFDDGNQGIVLSSVHRAKGLEADRVTILGPEMLPAKWAKTPEEQQQERHLHYVAVTRAKQSLTLQPLPNERR